MIARHLYFLVLLGMFSPIAHSEGDVLLGEEAIPTVQKIFFERLKGLCGKAFEGKIVSDTSGSPGWEGKKLVMHVMSCTNKEIRIPFHVGDDHSRTWIISKTGAGLSLKHDHRHKDGTSDKSTMYGGHTKDEGWAEVQSFPADKYSKDLFVEMGIPQSIDNTWQMFLYADKFSYRLIRYATEFQVDFDVLKPIEIPPKPWGY